MTKKLKVSIVTAIVVIILIVLSFLRFDGFNFYDRIYLTYSKYKNGVQNEFIQKWRVKSYDSYHRILELTRRSGEIITMKLDIKTTSFVYKDATEKYRAVLPYENEIKKRLCAGNMISLYRKYDGSKWQVPQITIETDKTCE